MTKTTRPKAKKGQILVFALVLMAIGLIVITPLLHFLDSSYTIYSKIQANTFAYYAADAMMDTILADMASGQNISDPTQNAKYNNANWIDGCSVSTTINPSATIYTSPQQSDEWAYDDPGCGLGLGSLASDSTYSFKVYLTENSSVTVHWYFNDQCAYGDCDPLHILDNLHCEYHCKGEMWITDANNLTVQYSNGSNVDTGTIDVTNNPFNQSLGWNVSVNGSGNYYINFKNLAWRKQMDCLGACYGTYPRAMSDVASPPAFSGTGGMSGTWVRVATINAEGTAVQYHDYTITTTAATGNSNRVSITAGLRESPGPLIWQNGQTVKIISWQVTYP